MRFRRSTIVPAILVVTLAVGATACAGAGKSPQAPRAEPKSTSPTARVPSASPTAEATSARPAAKVTSASPTAEATSAGGFQCSAKGSSATTLVPVVGAIANGTTDDSDAIQNAIDLAGKRGGGVVALPAGTFMVNSHLVLMDNVELTGVGPATVIKAGPDFLATTGPGGGYPLISTGGASNTTIANLTADQSGNTLDGDVSARLSGYVVEGFWSQNVVIKGVYVRNPFTYSIAMVDTTDFCVDDNNVDVTGTINRYNQLDGIHILDSNSGQVINNFVVSGDDGLVAHTIGRPTYNVLYANNKVRGGIDTDGIQLAVGDFPIYNITIEDNDFYGSLFGIRSGYYDKGTGPLYDTLIIQNYIHDLTSSAETAAIEITGSVIPGIVRGITAVDNRVCDAGTVTIVPGPDDVVKGTTGCSNNG